MWKRLSFLYISEYLQNHDSSFIISNILIIVYINILLCANQNYLDLDKFIENNFALEIIDLFYSLVLKIT